MCFFCTYLSYNSWKFVKENVLSLPGYLLYVSGMAVFLYYMYGVIFTSKKAQCEGHQRKNVP